MLDFYRIFAEVFYDYMMQHKLPMDTGPKSAILHTLIPNIVTLPLLHCC